MIQELEQPPPATAVRWIVGRAARRVVGVTACLGAVAAPIVAGLWLPMAASDGRQFLSLYAHQAVSLGCLVLAVVAAARVVRALRDRRERTTTPRARRAGARLILLAAVVAAPPWTAGAAALSLGAAGPAGSALLLAGLTAVPIAAIAAIIRRARTAR